VRILPVDTTEIRELLLQQPGYVRSPGLHMSDIYNSLYQELDPKRYKKGKPNPLRMAAGLFLETGLETGLRSRLIVGERPGEYVSAEGIICSPDLIIFNSHTRVGEIKLTWMSTKGVPREKMSSNGFSTKFDKYMDQMMSYCHVLDTNLARLIVFFVNGDWKTFTPELLAWDLEFSRREMDECWARLMHHARQRSML